MTVGTATFPTVPMALMYVQLFAQMVGFVDGKTWRYQFGGM